MNCEQIENRLDDYLDGELMSWERDEVEVHLAACPGCRTQLRSRQELLAMLREMPVPPMEPGFRPRAFRRVRQLQPIRRGFMAGFGSAVAAGLALWIGLATWMHQETPRTPPLQPLVLLLEQPRELRLVFTAQEELQQVEFTLELPEGVELAGFPRQRQLHWRDRLAKGRNALSLSLVASSQVRGEVVATLNQKGHLRVFRIPVRADGDSSGYLPALEDESHMI